MRQAMMSSRPPPAPEERVLMIRMIATVAAGATLWAALAGVNPAAQGAPQSASQPAPGARARRRQSGGAGAPPVGVATRATVRAGIHTIGRSGRGPAGAAGRG